MKIMKIIHENITNVHIMRTFFNLEVNQYNLCINYLLPETNTR